MNHAVERSFELAQVIRRFWICESGATAIEYGLIAALLGAGVAVALTNLQTSLIGLFESIEVEFSDYDAA